MHNLFRYTPLAALVVALCFVDLVRAAGPVPFDLPARMAQPYEQRLREQEARQRQPLLTPPPAQEAPRTEGGPEGAGPASA